MTMPALRPGPLAIIVALLAVLLGHDVGMATMSRAESGHRHRARAALHHHADRAAEEAPGHPPGCASVRAATVQRQDAPIAGVPGVARMAVDASLSRDRSAARPLAVTATLARSALQVWRI